MKIKIIIAVVVIAILGFTGLKVFDVINKDYVPEVKVAIPIQIVKIKESELGEKLTYQGRITPETIEIISFKSNARLAEFNGVIGEVVKEGTLLAGLDISDMELSLEAADNQVYAASANYNRASKGARAEDIELASINVSKANEAVEYLTNQVTKITTLFNEGIVSKSELDKIILELELASKDHDLAIKNFEKASNGTEIEVIQAAEAQLALARINREAMQSLIDDASYSMKADYILLDQMYEVGELVPAGYPIAIIRSIEETVVVGVSSRDLKNVYKNQQVIVQSEEVIINGFVQRVSEIPDEKHFLYEVEIALEESMFKIGEIVNCQLVIGSRKVIMIPISAIMNDGIDYVYINENGIATTKKVNIIEVVEGEAVVTGLNIYDELIVSNLNRIHEQSKVTVEE